MEIKHSRDFALNRKHTNVLAMTVPQRHDLHELSCINKKIQVFNRKLSKMKEKIGHAVIVETTLSRNDFTKRALPCNTTIKERMVDLTGKKKKTLLTKH